MVVPYERIETTLIARTIFALRSVAFSFWPWSPSIQRS